MQIGKISINVEAIADISEKDFKQMFVGVGGIKIEEIWKEFKKQAKQYKKASPEKEVFNPKKKKKAHQ